MRLLPGLQALLVTNPINIRYLTGFIGAAPEEREAFALLTENQLFLFTNSLYLEAAQKLSNPTNLPIKCIEISRENPFAKKLGEALKRSHPASQGETLREIRLGFEENDLKVSEYTQLRSKLKGVQLVPTKNRIENMRMIKRDDEIENIRQAAKITDECFSYLTSILKPGVTESRVAWEIESFFRKRDAQSAFSPIVAFGSHSSQPHFLLGSGLKAPQGLTLSDSDIVLLDFGARVHGYCSDMTRTVFVGKPKVEWRQAYEVVLQAQSAALENIHNNPDREAREIIQMAGFPVYPHSLGHGVGLAIHEQPRINYKRNIKLLPRMVVTIEPAIYVEGRYGIRIEDLVLLKKESIEILSKSPKTLTIL